jgi:hypothetical protein
MRVWICVVLVACQAPPPSLANEPVSNAAPPSPSPVASPWFPVLTGQLAAVSVERALYMSAGPALSIYIHVRIDNRAGSPIWVCLNDYWTTIYPNQWERSQRDHRGAINERRVSHGPLDRDTARMLLATCVNTRIEVGGSADVYRDFTGSDYHPAVGRWMLVALDGRVVATDGTRVDDLVVGDDEASRILVVPAAPLVWRALPARAHVIHDVR